MAGVGDEFAAGGVAVGRFLREGFGEYFLEAGQGGRVVFELGEQGGGVGAAAERRLAGEALVEEAAERVDVGAAVDLFAADLLGGDVVGGAERAAGAERGCRVAEVAAQPEVGKIDMPVLVEQHVRRLHVAMHETTGVSGVERARDLLHDPNGPGRLERPAAQHDLQVAAHDEAHHDVELPVDLARVVDRHHVRMLQRRSHPRLRQKPLPKRDVLGEMRRQQLQRHIPVEREIMGPIDHTHPATSQQRLQPIAGQLRPHTRVRC